MSFLPPGFVVATELARHNQAQLDIYGFMATHTPAGSQTATSVAVIRVDPVELSAVAVAMMLVGYASLSGFVPAPAKGDSMTVAAVVYRVFDVQGPDTSGAYSIHLTK